MPVTSTGDAILRGIMLVLGVSLAAWALWLETRPNNTELGCLWYPLVIIVFSLIIGGVAGPQAAVDAWRR